MIPTITAFEQSPDCGQGLARDLPVRWALEEVGQPYDVRLVSFSAMQEGAHRALQPLAPGHPRSHGYLPRHDYPNLIRPETLRTVVTYGTR